MAHMTRWLALCQDPPWGTSCSQDVLQSWTKNNVETFYKINTFLRYQVYSFPPLPPNSMLAMLVCCEDKVGWIARNPWNNIEQGQLGGIKYFLWMEVKTCTKNVWFPFVSTSLVQDCSPEVISTSPKNFHKYDKFSQLIDSWIVYLFIHISQHFMMKA